MVIIANSGYSHNDSDFKQDKKMYATGILIRHDNSYPFQERTLSLDQPIKIGRSVARARAATDNAIFDCKVLSRNHALLWFDCGKFYLKDTKSSNGTFVNNKRLSPSGEESVACEVNSGDIVQFGVDVVESTKKVTHGCIVATLKLYLPDGKEAKATFLNAVTYVNVTLEDLYKLNQFIQEAGRRENALRSKLEYMQKLLDHTRCATDQSWKALVLEDCLLSRLEMLESQVVVFSKNFGKDKLRNKLINLLEDKAKYQNATKELLQKKVQEKKEIADEVHILKFRLNKNEEETQSLHNIIKNNQNELQEIAIKYLKLQQILHETTDTFNKAKQKLEEITKQSEKDKQEFTQKFENQKIIEKSLQICLQDSKLDTVNIQKQISAIKNHLQTLQDKKSESLKFKDNKIPFDAINIILSKWDSMYVEFSNNEFKDKEPNILNINQCNEKIYKQLSLNKNYFENNSIYDLISYQNYNHLTPTFSKTWFLSNNNGNSKNVNDSNENNLVLSNQTNSTYLSNKKFDVQKLTDILASNRERKSNENIGSVKLIMRFCTDKNNQNFKKNPLYSQISFNSENFLSNTFFIQPYKKAHQITNHNFKLNEKLNFVQDSREICKSNMSNSYLRNTLKPLINKNINSSAYLKKQEKSHNQLLALNKDYISNGNLHLQLYFLKQWLIYESNDIIENTFSKYYQQWKIEIQQTQKLNEHLVILKERYYAVHEEKTNLSKKYLDLKNQFESEVNKSYQTVSIYYIVPIVIVLIWMLLEKIF